VRVEPGGLPGLVVVTPDVHLDQRGFFLETWREARYREHGIDARFVQDNHSRSVRGTLRGLHYQIGAGQGKLVQAMTGEIFDVAVDLRRSSPTFGRWAGVILSARDHRQLWIPPGLAHGIFCTSDLADVTYKCTAPYVPELERCLRWDDPDVGISWPLVDGRPPILSSKDAAGASLRDAPTFA